ncbi:MAG: TauD/TfdA family dioxygenase [Rhizobiaceae bacterium]|nr:TauD/TfdA family dioxygenase [Rhizobiaceae bacterium]
MMVKSVKNQQYVANSMVFLPGNDAAYLAWREKKLASRAANPAGKIIDLYNLSQPADQEINAIISQCEQSNMAIYQVQPNDSDCVEGNAQNKQARLRADLKRFCALLGLRNAEAHRSQMHTKGDDGIVALEVSNRGVGAGYIPYTNKALSWHTDGYYNDKNNRIKAMVLHCVRDASEGGVNELLDPQIAYIRLRDANMAYIEALMHEEAMTIPENTDKRSAYRPASVGPVFFLDEFSGELQMRYSARGRNIIWRDNKDSNDARAMIGEILANDEHIVRHKLKPGQGVISNNVLHNRTGFINPEGESPSVSTRLLYRIRYKERVTRRAEQSQKE